MNPDTRARSSSHRSRGVPAGEAPNASLDTDTDSSSAGLRVPVNEDFLFDVDIEKRELAPVYWLGPIYEVRRGTWFCTRPPESILLSHHATPNTIVCFYAIHLRVGSLAINDDI